MIIATGEIFLQASLPPFLFCFPVSEALQVAFPSWLIILLPETPPQRKSFAIARETAYLKFRDQAAAANWRIKVFPLRDKVLVAEGGPRYGIDHILAVCSRTAYHYSNQQINYLKEI